MSTYEQIKEEGRIEGIIEAMKEFVERGHHFGLSIDLLIKVTGFTIDEINNILSKNTLKV
jgi:predicted transposase YdaD